MRRTLIKLPPAKGIKMEEMVSSPDYFEEKIFKKLTPSIEIDRNFTLDIFKGRDTTPIEITLSHQKRYGFLARCSKEFILEKYYEYEINTSMSTWNYDVSFF